MSDITLFEQMIQALKKENFRITKQRNEILKLIISNKAHVDADNILQTLKRKNIHVSRATIYRTLDILVQNSLVDRIDFGDGRARYEIKAGQSHHDHLICIKCGKVVEFINPSLTTTPKSVCDEYGFKYLNHFLQVYGTCPKCSEE